LKGAAIGHNNPGDVLKEVNDLLYDDNETMMFVTLLYAVYDPDTGNLTYANGGHNPPLIVRENGESALLPTTQGVALGIVPLFEYQQSSVTISPGDTFIFYTDGVTEAMNSDGEEFGVERLRQVFADSPHRDCQAATEAVFQAVSAFAGSHPQSDDITCVALRPDGGS
jgi:sigma-B regulation protein RsbU (phosphoserine phosphatase)